MWQPHAANQLQLPHTAATNELPVAIPCGQAEGYYSHGSEGHCRLFKIPDTQRITETAATGSS